MSQYPNNQMISGFDLYPTKPELSGFKNNKIISGVFETKSSSYESAWSPTSSLDFRVFSNLGFSGSSPMSIQGQHKNWDSRKVGLSIVDSLDDKNMIFGSWIRTLNPKLQKPNACQVIKQSPRSLPESEIEISEDYTCVISYGSNPKTTRFYGDQILNSVENNELNKDKKDCIFVVAPLNLTMSTDLLLTNELLSFCCSCKKKLSIEEDIYMYRGYKPFCSSECRSEKIHLDEEEEDEEAVMSGSFSDKDLSKKSNSMFFTVV